MTWAVSVLCHSTSPGASSAHLPYVRSERGIQTVTLSDGCDADCSHSQLCRRHCECMSLWACSSMNVCLWKPCIYSIGIGGGNKADLQGQGLEKRNISATTFEGKVCVFQNREIFYPRGHCFCCWHNPVPSRKTVKKCLQCRLSLLSLSVLEFLPAASQMVFNNADTLRFGVAGAVPSYAVLDYKDTFFQHQAFKLIDE